MPALHALLHIFLAAYRHFDYFGRMKPPQRQPSLTPSFLPSSRAIGRVITGVESPEPHLGWYSRGYQPHWDHPGTLQSLNFRLADALPAMVVNRWKSELAGKAEDEASAILHERVEKYLDGGCGECWLRVPTIAQLVERALRHFDGQRYRLLAWCIMPNHVHALIEAGEGFPLPNILHSWKSFTSKEADKILQRHGEFWERDYFDRYIRSAEHYVYAVAYIEENPVKAGLARVKTDYPWSSARFRPA